MANEAAELLEQALKLPAAARAALVDSLVESLDDAVDDDAGDAWRAEITRRVEELNSGIVKAVSWDETRRQLRRRFP